MRGRRTLSTAQRRLAVVALLLAAFIGIALLAFTAGGNTTDRAEAATGGPEMTLTIESTGSCDDPIAPAVCNILPGDTFLAKIAAVTIPASGYIVMQAALDFGNYDATASEDGAGPNTCSDTIDNGPDGDADRDDPDCVTVALTYIPAASAADEVVWPDGHPDTAITIVFGPGLVASGALSGQGGGLPTSFHVGPLVEWTFLCSPTPTTTVVSLLPFGGPIAGNDGSAFAAASGGGGSSLLRATQSLSTASTHRRIPSTPTVTAVPTSERPAPIRSLAANAAISTLGTSTTLPATERSICCSTSSEYFCTTHRQGCHRTMPTTTAVRSSLARVHSPTVRRTASSTS